MEIGERIKAARIAAKMTQAELAEKLGVAYQNIGQIESGKRNPKVDTLQKIADALGVRTSELFGIETFDSPEEFNAKWREITGRSAKESAASQSDIPPGFIPLPPMDRLPRVGAIACGTPILAEENIEDYASVPSEWGADFVLLCQGDSMEPLIRDGDLVAIRRQPEVENGQLAAVLIGTEATLKRVYLHDDFIELRPENTAYQSIIRRREEMDDVRIEGKVVGFCRRV